MAAISDIRQAISDSITAVGILSYPTARDASMPPEAQVGPLEGVEYDYTMARGTDRWLIPVRLYACRVEEMTGQDDLDNYLAGSGPLSIKQAVEADAEWATLAPTSVRVMEARNEGMYRSGGVELLGVEFLVEVVV
jgi:hypothetical protein